MTAAKIVYNINEHESIEIPYEYYTEDKKNKKGSHARFYYLDIKEYERKVRADERARVKNRKIQCRKDFIKISKAILKYTWQKAVGAAIVFCSVSSIYTSYVANMEFGFGDGMLAALTIPVGIYMIFSKYFFFKKRT